LTDPLVTVAVPAYRGQDALPVLLECLTKQSYTNIDVLISVDGGDLATAEACEPLVRQDSRLRMHVQSARLGWAGNTNWTMRHSRGDFYIYQQHDDLISPTYISDLVDAARRWPDSAICFSKLRYVGSRSWEVSVPSVVGDRVARVLDYLRRLDWIPFRGLIRSRAMDSTSGLLLSDFDPFDSLGTEIRFMAELALAGEFRFVQSPTYFKNWNGKNLSAVRSDWPRSHRIKATACWAAWMIEVITPAGTSVQDRLRLFMITLDRFARGQDRLRWITSVVLNAARAGVSAQMVWTQLKRNPVPPGLGRISGPEREFLLRIIIERLKGQGRFPVGEWLNMSWGALETEIYSRYYRTPHHECDQTAKNS
jgi:glycosyltransferase involved in cell wall biosynthesis